MDNKRLSRTRKYNNNQFIIASRAYFQQDHHHLAQVDHVQGKGFPLIGFLFYRSCGGSWETEL